jgi:hypothetical protein
LSLLLRLLQRTGCAVIYVLLAFVQQRRCLREQRGFSGLIAVGVSAE